MTTSIIKRNNGTPIARPLSGWVDRLLNENLGRMFNDDLWGFDGVEHKMNVPVNLRETDKTYEIELVAPGLQKQDFKLNLSNNLLTIAFEQKQEISQENKNEGWLRKEYNLQSFTRSFTLDDTVEQSKIEANYENGLLHITLPKKENAQRLTKTIQVK